MQQQFTRACLLLLAGVLTASCSDTDAPLTTTQPSDIGSSAVKVAATSATASAQPTDDPACPAVAPFRVSLGVVVSANGSPSVVVTSIRARFVDTTGRQQPSVTVPMPPVTLPAPTAATFERTFPFAFGIGCGTGTTGTVIITVDGSDARGRRFSEQVHVTVE